jgi:hypothetical protein
MNTNRPAPLDLAARDRAIAVVGFGALAAASDDGAATSAATSATTDTTTSGTTSTTSTLGSGVAPQPATGTSHTTTGGS